MISERKTENGLTFIDIETSSCTASLCLQGAHLTSWIPTGQRDCFFISPLETYLPGKAIRGGVPLCWPWFGKKKNLPSHGVARTSIWTLDHCSEDNDTHTVSISLRLCPDDESLPMAFLRLRLGTTLQMSLQTTARHEPCTLANAFHNYFSVGDVTQCRLFGLEDVAFEEFAVKAIPHGKPHVPVVPLCPIDRIYSMPHHNGLVRLDDLAMGRSIEIHREGASSIVVWNPWDEGAISINDLNDEGWRDFFCVETANTQPNELKLAPGQSHCLKQSIQIMPLI
ncbi:MAG: D-hexose-6-phosphate mutarotase [Akkermansia sp.]